MICPWAGNLTANFSKTSNPHPMPCLPPAGLTLIGALYLQCTSLPKPWSHLSGSSINILHQTLFHTFVIINCQSGVFVIGAQENISSTSQSLSQAQWNALPKEVSSWGKVWSFKRCQISATVYHSGSYKQGTARKNFTVSFSRIKESEYGSGLNYVKVQGKCYQASCSNVHCNCQLECSFFVLIRILVKCQEQLPCLKATLLVSHTIKVEKTTKIVAVPLMYIEQKCMLVSTSNRMFVCQLANRMERD